MMVLAVDVTDMQPCVGSSSKHLLMLMLVGGGIELRLPLQ